MMCINLQERFGSEYRITFDTSYDAHGRRKATRDPWMMQIPCRRGVIYPHGHSRLAVEVDHRPKIAAQLSELHGVRLLQDGDGEKTFLFDVTDFSRVAAIVKPRKRRRWSDEQRRLKAELLARVRPQPLSRSSFWHHEATFSCSNDL